MDLGDPGNLLDLVFLVGLEDLENLMFIKMVLSTDYGHTKAKSLILYDPNKYLGCGYKGLVFL